MRKVELTMKENYKYQVIKKLVESNGNKSNAAIKLNCTVRNINRLIRIYSEEGKEGFIHGNRNRKPSTTISLDIKQNVIDLYTNIYYDFNITHFNEHLRESHNIYISDNTIRNWLFDERIISPLAKKTTKRKMKEALKRDLQKSSSIKEKDLLDQEIKILDYPDIHPRKPRKAYFGELLLMDASQHLWFGTEKYFLHVAIDDATGTIVGAYFDKQETLNGYYHVLKQILCTYGIPYAFQTDNRTIFNYKKDTSFEKEDTHTNFSYACHILGIQLSTTSVAQEQGRVERLFGTLQSRLIAEMRLEGVSDVEEANQFLQHYIKKFNGRFSFHLNNIKSVFEPQPTNDIINQTLARFDERVIDSGHSIKYKNNVYIPIDQEGKRIHLRPKTRVMVIESFEEQFYVSLEETLYAVELIPTHELKSKDFDVIPDKPKKKPYIPPLDHPWKQASYLQHLAKQKHRNNGAHVS